MATKGLDSLSLQELQDWHARIVLAVVRGHGVAAAMQLIGHSLQSLAAQAQELIVARTVDILPAAAVAPTRRWQSTLQKALVSAAADPWRGMLHGVPSELAVRRTWDHETGTWKADVVLIRVERQPFAHGAMRQCFRMKILRGATRGWDGAAGTNFVGKSYPSDPNSASLLEADVKMQSTAKWFAECFNREAPPKPVDFVQCALVALPARGWATFGVEVFLEGSFTKYSSNSGFVTDEVVRHTPHAFSHYTYERSKGEQMVVDVQGVGDLLTDPQIHTRAGGRGGGDLGLRGMALFFASHRCNALCRQLRCRPFASPPTVPSSATLPTTAALGDTLAPPTPGVGPSLPRVGTELLLAPMPLVALSSQLRRSDETPTSVEAPAEPVLLHAPLHFMLALLHARAIRSGDETIGPGSHASPALGLFHLSISADLGHTPAILALACLHQQIRPRKGVLAGLSQALQRPLAIDHERATRYTLLAAEQGVASAMCAAAHAYDQGLGTAPSAASAARWYRRAIGARGQPDELNDDLENEAECLPGGDASEEGVLLALARLYEGGGTDLPADLQLAHQFAYLARSSRRRGEEDEEDEADGEDEEDEHNEKQPAAAREQSIEPGVEV